MYVFLDGLASLYTYTGNNPKAQGQSWLRDQSWRIVRSIVGIALMIIGSQIRY
ncbi:unnamed protein product [marine sediment metagenome]|uniref:Uncharacterized protein n=1 Tax=marine sediment metagenome TaxID=412755 RepID=X1BH62_9ZZZZ